MQEIIIAKKYAKALSDCSNIEQIIKTHRSYSCLQYAFESDKFSEAVNSHIMSKEDKFKLVCSIIESINEELDSKSKRLISLLAENNRLCLIPIISKELKKIIDGKNNTYIATLLTKERVDETTLQSIKTKLEKRININLEISQTIDHNIDGICLDIHDLGIEITFLKNKFMRELQEFILKAI